MPASPGAVKRVAAGTVMAAAGLASLLAGPRPLFVVLTVLFVAAYLELRRLLAADGSVAASAAGAGPSPATTVLGAVAVVGFCLLAASHRTADLPWVLAALVLTALVVRIVIVESGAGTAAGATVDIASATAAAGVVGLLGGHVFLLRSFPRFGFPATLVLVAMVFANDAMAFLVGRLAGRHPLSSRLSPAKTWEGLAAGTAATFAGGVVALVALDPPFRASAAMLLAAIVAAGAAVGDLAGSAVKRSVGVKDSGPWLPAMGGAFDILDGLLFSAPLYYWAFRALVT